MAHSEIDPYSSKVLKKHWPDVPNLGDVSMIQKEHIEPLGPVDLVFGGFPCQDLSRAGNHGGITASRSGLFFDLMRVVRMVRPRYVLLENVAALLGRAEWMGAVLGELASCGYDATWDCLPAFAVGAPHRRDRIFILAHASGAGSQEQWGREPAHPEKYPAELGGEAMADANGGRHQAPQKTLLAGWPPPQLCGRWKTEPDVGRVVDGDGVRVDLVRSRLRCLGNAVVPQVAEHMGKILMSMAASDR